jgi:hypothetical protein
MRRLEAESTAPEIERNSARDSRLEAWLQMSSEQLISDRRPQEVDWVEQLRQYAARPAMDIRHVPVPDAPNIEVPLGATKSDMQYARMMSLLFTSSPVLTARAEDDDWEANAKAMQRWVNYLSDQVDFRLACEHAFMDCIMLGTAGLYTPFVKDTVTGRIAKTIYCGPKIYPVAPEDLLLLGGSRGKLQEDQLVALRFYYTPQELQARERQLHWDTTHAQPCATVEYVRRFRERYGLTHSSNVTQYTYEIWRTFCHFDYHDDGEPLDLEVIFDKTSGKVLDLQYNQYDERPLGRMVYQLQPNIGYGLGVMGMLRPLQWEATEMHCAWILNMFIANAKVWIAQDGAVPDNLEVWFNRIIRARDINAIKPLEMGDVYPSMPEALVANERLADARIGTDNTPEIGNRTPGITAMQAMQAQNSRFGPAFDSMRLTACEAMRQCLQRQREVLLAGGKNASWVEREMRAVLHDEAELVLEVLEEEDFDRAVSVGFTAVSPVSNREADRQATVLMFNTLMANYYRPAVELLQVASQQPMLAEAAIEVVTKVNELADRFLRTFDQVRDPRGLLLDLQGILQGIQQKAPQQQALQAVGQLLQGGGAAPEAPVVQ